MSYSPGFVNMGQVHVDDGGAGVGICFTVCG